MKLGEKIWMRVVNIDKTEKKEVINLLESGLYCCFKGLPDEKYSAEVVNGHLRLLKKIKNNGKIYYEELSRFNKIINNNLCYEFLVGGVYTAEKLETFFIKDELAEVKWYLETKYTKEQVIDLLARAIIDGDINFTK